MKTANVIDVEPPAQATPVQSATVLAFAPAHQAPVNPLDLPADVFRAGLDRRSANRAALMVWVRSAMRVGVDFGSIHAVGKNKCQMAAQGRSCDCKDPAHWSKPSLFKPGAEKICGMLGVTVRYPTLHDYEQAALNGIEIKNIIIRCEILDASGRVVADGVGARVLAQDYGDLNKALKMAEKSAHIDATLRMAGLSEVFTQDLEDMKPGGGDADQHQDKPPPPKEPPAPRLISEAQRKRLEARIGELGLDRGRVKDWIGKAWGIAHFWELHKDQYSRLDNKLTTWAKEATK